MLKRIIVVSLLIMFCSTAAMAATSSIGYIDLQKTLKSYKETDKSQDELEKKQKDYQKLLLESQQKLSDAEKAGKSQDELKKMRDDLEKKLANKQSEILKYNQDFNSKLQNKILSASDTISKKLGLDVILDKNAIIVGGMDVTDMIISEVNK